MENFDFDLGGDKSAAQLVKAVRRIDETWSATLPDDSEVLAYVLLTNGKTLYVQHLVDMGHNGLFIQGRDDADGEIYVLLAHQATVQFFFKVKKVTPEQPKRQIGYGPFPPPLTQT